MNTNSKRKRHKSKTSRYHYKTGTNLGKMKYDGKFLSI